MVAVTIAFTSLLVFLRLGFWLVIVAIVALLIALAYSTRLEPKNERRLTTTELVAVIIASLSEGSIMALLLFALYGVLWSLTVGIRWGFSNLLSWTVPPLGYVVLAIMAVIGSFLLLGVSVVTTEKLKLWVFPDTAIGNAPLLPYAKPGEASPRAIIATLAILVCVGLSLFLSPYFLILLQGCLAVISTSVSAKLEMREPSDHNKTIRAAVKAMLRACGYEVVDRLQTRRPELDRLIAVFHVVAHRSGYALAVQIKTDEEGTAPVSISEVTYLRGAARGIYGAFDEVGVPIHTVLPMMLLSGRTSDPSLVDFAQEQSIRVAQLPDWQTLEQIKDNKLEEEKVRELSLTYLGLRGADIAAQVKAS
jgi:hypothetical protein